MRSPATCEISGDVPSKVSATGLVVDDSTGAAVPDHLTYVAVAGTTCKADVIGGKFRITLRRPGDYALQISNTRAAHYVADTVPVRIDSTGTLHPALFRLTPRPCVAFRPTVRLSGVLRDAPSTDPIAGAWVFVVGGGCGTQTDSLGHWSISGAPTGRFRLRAWYVGYYPSDTTLYVPPSLARGVVVVGLAMHPMPLQFGH